MHRDPDDRKLQLAWDALRAEVDLRNDAQLANERAINFTLKRDVREIKRNCTPGGTRGEVTKPMAMAAGHNK